MEPIQVVARRRSQFGASLLAEGLCAALLRPVETGTTADRASKLRNHENALKEPVEAVQFIQVVSNRCFPGSGKQGSTHMQAGSIPNLSWCMLASVAPDTPEIPWRPFGWIPVFESWHFDSL